MEKYISEKDEAGKQEFELFTIASKASSMKELWIAMVNTGLLTTQDLEVYLEWIRMLRSMRECRNVKDAMEKQRQDTINEIMTIYETLIAKASTERADKCKNIPKLNASYPV